MSMVTPTEGLIVLVVTYGPAIRVVVTVLEKVDDTVTLLVGPRVPVQVDD